MKHRRTICILLALALMLALSIPALAADAPIAAPEAEPLTRGGFVTALYQLGGLADTGSGDAPFDDVPQAGLLASAVRWAADNGIVKGYGDGRFGPEDPVTREQMAAMFYRFAQTRGQGFTGMWMFNLDYPDAADVSAYADEAMHWVVMKKIIIGTDLGLEPKAYATPDQLSLLLQRWQKSVMQAEEGEDLWFGFDDAAIAMRLPGDMEFQSYNGGRTFIGTSGKVSVTVALYDRVCANTPEALAELVAGELSAEQESLHRGALDTVKVSWNDGSADYFLLSPDGDVYVVSAGPNTADYPELTPDDAAKEIGAIEDSLCHIMKIPEEEEYVRVFRPAGQELNYRVLVNKQNPLPEDWEDMLDTVFTVNSMGDEVEAERSAYKAYLALKADLAENDGIELELDSARRSVAAQQDIMDRFTEKYGADYAAKTVAKPGYSEHHTGLALDLYFRLNGEDVYYNEDMVRYPEIWEKIHAKLADYGFILRYPEGKEHITGYGYEPWHIRYLNSVEAAREIMAVPGQTLEVWLHAATDPELTVDYGSSSLYTRDELEEAMVQIKCSFAAWKGCELHSLRYAGDECSTEENIRWMNELDEGKNYVQVAEFLTDYRSPVDAYGAWEPNTEYTDWQWWLARTEDGGWQLLTNGY